MGDGLAVESEFSCHFDDEDLPYDVDVIVVNRPDGPVLTRLTVTMRNEPVTARVFRSVPVQRLLREAVAGQPVYRVNADGSAGRLRDGDEGAADVAAYVSAVEHEQSLGRRRIPGDDLAKVGDVYRAAVADGDPPVRAVQQQLRLRSRGQASRWVRAARIAGYL